jgi:hypothetical protein
MRRRTPILAIIGLAAFVGAAAAAEDKEYRLDHRVSIEIPGLEAQPVVAAKCYESWNATESGAVPNESVSRLLCRTISGSFAFYERMGYGTDGSWTFLLVDLDSAEWIRIRQVADIPSRDPEEGQDAFRRRIQDAFRRDEYNLEVESSSRLFDATEIEVVERTRQALWPELEISDPGVSRRIEWILGTLGSCASPHMAALLKAIELVYGGPPLRPPACTVVASPLGFSPLGEPLGKEAEKEFGKWAAFPDFPRSE